MKNIKVNIDCPYGIKNDFKEEIVLTGSRDCLNCVRHEGISTHKNIVRCNSKRKKEKK